MTNDKKKIVWVNGCFDILHPGHIKLLKHAKSLGDCLIVGIDSDNRVKKLKGNSRPFNNEEDRKLMLESLEFVDDVVIFGDNAELVASIQMNKVDIMVIGSDYKYKEVIGSYYVTKVVFFERDPGYSTTSILNRNSSNHGPIIMKHVEKGWGWEKWIINKKEYCGKLLFFAKGKRCSWHYHKIKDEVFYLQSGKMIVRFSYEDDPENAIETILEIGQNFYIPTGLRHQMIALEDSELFEFSTEHFDTDSNRIVKGD